MPDFALRAHFAAVQLRDAARDGQSQIGAARIFIGHYVCEAPEQLSQYHHPVLNMKGETVTSLANYRGGPCGDDWNGAAH